MTTSTPLIAEIVTFELADGVTDEQFVAASEQSEAFLRTSDAFISRYLSKSKNGQWTDYILWSDKEAALALAEELFKQPFAAQWMATINPDTVKMDHQTVVWQMST